MKNHLLSAAIGGLASVLLVTAAFADTVPVAPKQVGNIQYITGGIGDEERSSIEAVKNDYNLHITSAGTDGAFVGNTRLSILDSSNQSLLESDTGPLFYAKLPKGTYTIEGTHNNQTKSEKITIANNSQKTVTFSWK